MNMKSHTKSTVKARQNVSLTCEHVTVTGTNVTDSLRTVVIRFIVL